MSVIAGSVRAVAFGRAYAVVAIALADGAWHGIPVFSAWVAEPSEASD